MLANELLTGKSIEFIKLYSSRYTINTPTSLPYSYHSFNVLKSQKLQINQFVLVAQLKTLSEMIIN